jgi:hypothetical protein
MAEELYSGLDLAETRKQLEEHVRRCDNRVSAICESRDESIESNTRTVGAWGVTAAILDAEQARKDLALYDEMHHQKPPTPARVRNTDAHCGNCPYCVESLSVKERGVCGIDSKTLHAGLLLRLNGVCGDHPDFWK